LANNNFRRVDLRGLTKLKAADLHGNNLSLGLLLAGMANLDTLNAIYHYMTVAPDLTGCDNLVSLQLTSNSTGFSTIDITPCPKLKNVGLDKNSLTEACVNQVLATLVANGLRSGTLNIGGGTNAAPTGQGLIDKTTLVSRSWTVTTN
jgi:Leucine-rich repeat (LRR) protein